MANDRDSDREIARGALDFQARARDFRIVDLPGYMDWSRRKLAEGVSPALIAHLDARTMSLLPEKAAGIGEEHYEELLDDLRAEFGDD